LKINFCTSQGDVTTGTGVVDNLPTSNVLFCWNVVYYTVLQIV